jgi:hypothetical protein
MRAQDSGSTLPITDTDLNDIVAAALAGEAEARDTGIPSHHLDLQPPPLRRPTGVEVDRRWSRSADRKINLQIIGASALMLQAPYERGTKGSACCAAGCTTEAVLARPRVHAHQARPPLEHAEVHFSVSHRQQDHPFVVSAEGY